MPPCAKDEAEECEGEEASTPETQKAPVTKTPGPHASLAHTKRKLGKWRHTKHMRLYTQPMLHAAHILLGERRVYFEIITNI